MSTDVEAYLTTAQVCKKLGVSSETLRRWGKLGKIEFERTPGGKKRYNRRYISSFMKKGQTNGQ